MFQWPWTTADRESGRSDLDSHDLSSLPKPDATAPLVVGNRVYDALTFAPDVIQFTRKQYVFLNSYRLGTPIEEACARSEMTLDQAERFLHKPQTVAWLRDRSLMHHIKTEWEEPAKWWSMGNDVLEGRREFNKAQIVVFQEFGQRAVPKKSDTSGTTKIEINIDPQAVKDAFVRQTAIEGELA